MKTPIDEASHGAPRGTTSSRGAWLALLTVIVLAAYPVLSVTLPPLADLANHMARLHILAEIDFDPGLARNYEVHWSVQPNLAMQLVSLPLVGPLSVYDAMRLFAVLSLILPVIGTVAVYRVINGRLDFWPLFAALFLYNQAYAWGFLNYVCGAGLALLGLALWLALESRPAALRLAVSTLIATAVYLAHLSAFGAYALIVFLYGPAYLGRAVRLRPEGLRELAIRTLPFLLPFCFYVIDAPEFAVPYTWFGGLQQKLIAVVSPTLFNGGRLDFLAFGLAFLVLVGGLLTRRIAIAPAFRLPLIGLLAAATAMPHYLGGVFAVDWRLPTLLCCLLVATTRLEIKMPAARYVLAVLVLGLLTARSATLVRSFQGYDRDVAEFRVAADRLAPGTRLLVVENQAAQDQPPKMYRNAYIHIPALAVVERGVFLPSLFTYAGPIRASERNRLVDTPWGEPLSPDALRRGASSDEAAKLGQPVGTLQNRYYWADWPSHFDHVAWLHYGEESHGAPHDRLEPLVRGSFFVLYRVLRD